MLYIPHISATLKLFYQSYTLILTEKVTSTYHTKQLNPWANSSASRVVNHSQLSACQREMVPFEEHPSTRGCTISLSNKPNQKQPGQLLAIYLAEQLVNVYSHHFDGKKCVLLLCAWKPAFLRFGHIITFNFGLHSCTITAT